MTEVILKIEAITDPDNPDNYLRYQGLAVDEHLDGQFWSTQPDKKVGTISKSGGIEKTLDLGSGKHTIEYGISTWKGAWNITMSVNGNVVAKGSISRENIKQDQWFQGSIMIGPLGNVIPAKIPFISAPFLGKVPMMARMNTKFSAIRSRLRLFNR